MRPVRRVAGFAALGLAAASMLRFLRRRSRSPAKPPRSPGRAAWPDSVRKFVRLAKRRGAEVRDVRLEERIGRQVWVVEWNDGRTLTFPRS